jgi:fermentation-respiration switch protein FrsA (DUF1100 family)
MPPSADRLVNALLLLGGVAAVLIGLRFLSRSVAYPGARRAFPPPESLGPGARLLSVTTSDGLDLRAVRVSSGRPDAPVAVFFHGNGESAAQNGPLAVALADGGVDAVLAEYRGYGGMPGRPSESGLVADGEAVLAALRAEGVGPSRTALVGRSLGTGVAVELARRSPPALLLLVSPYTSFADLGRGLVGPLAPLVVADRFDNLSKIGTLACPVAILHGTRDEVVPFRMGKRLAAAGRDVRLVPLEGRGHNDIPDLPGLLLAEMARVFRLPARR